MSRKARGLLILGCHERLGELELVPGLVEARVEAGGRAGLNLRLVPGCNVIWKPDSRSSSLRQTKQAGVLSGVVKDLAEFGGGELDRVGFHAAGGGGSLAEWIEMFGTDSVNFQFRHF